MIQVCLPLAVAGLGVGHVATWRDRECSPAFGFGVQWAAPPRHPSDACGVRHMLACWVRLFASLRPVTATRPGCSASEARGEFHISAAPSRVGRSAPFLPLSRWYELPLPSAQRAVGQDEKPLSLVARTCFKRRKQSRRNAVAQALKVVEHDGEGAR